MHNIRQKPYAHNGAPKKTPIFKTTRVVAAVKLPNFLTR